MAFGVAVVAPILGGGVPVATDTLALWGPLAKAAPQAVHNQVLADSALQNLPWQVFVRRSLVGGEWPLWDPNLFSGYPFLGNDQNQLYYPIAWLLLLLPLPTAIQTNVLLHLWLAGVGMYFLARVLGASRTGSVIAGLAFAGSGQLYTSLEMTGILDIYVWLPWVVAASELTWRRRSWGWTAVAGLLYGVLAVAGHLPWFIYSSMFMALWVGAHVAAGAWDAWRGRTPGGMSAWTGQAARAIAIPVWGLALAAVHLIPFAQMVGLSSRATAEGLAAGPDQLDRTVRLLGRQLNLFVPQFFGNSVGNVGSPLTFNNCWYVGLLPLALAMVALLVRRERTALFLGAVGLSAFAVAAGLPFFNRLHQLPGLQAQLPQRAAYIFIFCAVALSGLGFDALLGLAHRRSWAVVGVVTGLAVAGALVGIALVGRHKLDVGTPALYNLQTQALGQAALIAIGALLWAVGVVALRGGRWWWGRAVLAGVALGIMVVDLLTYASGYNTYVPASTLSPHVQAVDVMKGDAGQWRMMAPDAPVPMFVPNMATLFGMTDVQGYDSLHLKRYEDYWAAVEPAIKQGGYFNVMIRPQNYTSILADLLNVKYVATWDKLPTSPPKLEQIYAGGVYVYVNKVALPRAFTVGRAEMAPADRILARMSKPGFDPRKVVLIEQVQPTGIDFRNDDSSPGSAIISSYRNLSVDIEARMERAGWVVLGDVNYPGWNVEVDGRPVQLYTADYVLRTVPLSAGTHRVHFYFRPVSVMIGGAISAFALLAALGAVARGRKTKDES